MSDKRDILNGSPLLAGLPPEAVEELLTIARTQRLGDGELLYAQGDEGDAMYGILSGSVRLSNHTSDGRELLVMQVERGDWIGEVSLFDGLPRSQTARALGHCEILVLDGKPLQALLDAEPGLYRHFIPMLCRKLRLALSYVEGVSLYSLPERLRQRLLELGEFYGQADGDNGTLIDLHLPQEDLAKMLAVSRQAVSRELKKLEAEGLIRLAYGKLWLCDLSALRDAQRAGR
ncbi:Crp/Fnr family transcriptional regulator [Spongiibacter nanhainus]|uniref:Crp/Fnr family transcriptional regulator n=1 Tax=Spongiibacter nanhainus TaxID=2794344 RepID=A0A7T4R1R5_9GAMM|nr:Crp/Fnr family transcriptional regulator [Spongiibacter nanhainus]QQD18657.1 Crp/Fnr family transcriptional regulator [Spongiibacter nanhainus]